MWTFLIWLVLAAFFLLILAAILPIRFGGRALCRDLQHFSYQFSVSYIHPAIIRFICSSEEGNTLKIFGISLKRKRRGKQTVKDSEESEEEPRPQTSTSEQAYDKSEEKQIHPDEKSESQAHEPYRGAQEAVETESEDNIGFFARIRKRWEKIKRSKFYRLINDAIWRKKIAGWLGRLWNSAITTVVFDKLNIRTKIGLKDPAILGKLCGYFTAARCALQLQNRKIDMILEPVFMKDHLEFEAQFMARTSVWRAASRFFAVFIMFPYFRTYRVLRKKSK